MVVKKKPAGRRVSNREIAEMTNAAKRLAGMQKREDAMHAERREIIMELLALVEGQKGK